MVSCTVPQDTPIPPAREWTAETPAILRAAQLRAIEGWHPALRGIVERTELESMFMIPFGRLEPAEPWEPSRVTLIGDAAHAMLPTLGMGANLSLRDAGALTRRLTGADDVVAAVGAYEAEMREVSLPVHADDRRARQALRRGRTRAWRRRRRRRCARTRARRLARRRGRSGGPRPSPRRPRRRGSGSACRRGAGPAPGRCGAGRLTPSRRRARSRSPTAAARRDPVSRCGEVQRTPTGNDPAVLDLARVVR